MRRHDMSHARNCKPHEFPRPLVIGHRGAHGYAPAHTLEGYALAIELGADYIEPDLVSTKDGHLVARHEPNMIATTDVARRPEFASRRRVAVVDGVSEDGFFASDFTLAEVKQLRAVQDFPDRPQQLNGKFGVPTFEEVVALAKRKAEEKGHGIGIYPETKHPTYHESLGLPLEKRLVQAVTDAGWNRLDAPVFIQSFEQSSLIELRNMTPVRLVQLVDTEELSESALETIADYAAGIAPCKRCIAGSDVIVRAHAHGLFVHAWTFRNEPQHLAAKYVGNPAAEYLDFYGLGVDGVFSDFPDTAVAARTLFEAGLL
jgi:glycerophosphoryl diester phosphodiesterase